MILVFTFDLLQMMASDYCDNCGLASKLDSNAGDFFANGKLVH